MKKLINKYGRECRASLMLLLVYSVHLFAFNAILASHCHFFAVATSSKENGTKKTDYILLLAKHEVVKQKDTKESTLDFAPSKIALTPVLRYPLLCSSNIVPQRLPEDSYKRYRLLKVLII